MENDGKLDKQHQLPHFLAKLWSILDDPQYEEAICWDKSGESFHIVDSYLFKNAVLPRYFKHNNLNSFVRQLNLYGFRKIPVVGNGALLNDNGDNLHFIHPLFLKGNFHLLQHIKRNAVKGTGNTKVKPEPEIKDKDKKTVSVPEDDLIGLLQELKIVREKQSGMKNTITQLTRDNILLWQEMAALRNAQTKQQENVGKLVQFLMSLVQPQKRMNHNTQRIMQLDEVDEASQRGSNKQPLPRGPQRAPLDFGILDNIQRELRESFDIGSTLSMNAENALLEGLQLRKRAIEEGGPYLENGVLNENDDEEGPSSSRSLSTSLQRYRATDKRSFQQSFPAYSSSSLSLTPKKYLKDVESPTRDDIPTSSQIEYDYEVDPNILDHYSNQLSIPSENNDQYLYVDEHGNQVIPDFDLGLHQISHDPDLYFDEDVLNQEVQNE